MLLSKMYYRISKYNPIDRIDGIYQVDDWTSYSDIGEQYGGRVVQPSEYLAVETVYKLYSRHMGCMPCAPCMYFRT